MRLEPLEVWFQPVAGPLLPQLRPALVAAAQVQAGAGAQLFRWAITAAEPGRGLRIEAVLLVGPTLGTASGLEPGQLAFGSQAHDFSGCVGDAPQDPEVASPGAVSSGLMAPRPTPAQAAIALPGL